MRRRMALTWTLAIACGALGAAGTARAEDSGSLIDPLGSYELGGARPIVRLAERARNGLAFTLHLGFRT